jgi:hypothetical protein
MATETQANPKGKSAAPPLANLETLLFSSDEKNVLLALTLAKAQSLTGSLLADVLATALFSPHAKIRKEGRTLLATAAPDAIRARFDGDKRNYASLKDGGKLTKLAKELEGLGVDVHRYNQAVLRTFRTHEDAAAYTLDAPLKACFAFPGQDEVALSYLADMDELYLDDMKKVLPKGIGQLTKLKTLRLAHCTHTTDTHVEELATIPQRIELQYWVKNTDFKHLEKCKANVRALELRGGYSGVSDIARLASWKHLEDLDLSETGVVVLTPLKDLPLRRLKLGNTMVTDLSPLSGITTLESLDLEKSIATDYTPLSTLTNLQRLNVSRCPVTDLSFVRPLQKLTYLEMHNTSVSSLAPLVGTKLERIVLMYSTVPDLMPLTEIATLKDLDLLNAKFDEASYAAFATKRPDVTLRR